MVHSRKLAILTSFLIFFFVFYAKAQYYSTGVDPASAKWKQINTDNFQIIFQEEFTDQAQKTANILEYYYLKAGKSLNHFPKKISVIIHNQTILSNGYVAWAPKRMELYATPPQDALPDPWLEHLCIHELRHVVQIDKLNQGITKILSIVFGEQATALVAGQFPMWYYEGDAVCTETAVLNFGRGRIPSFQMGIKTNLLSDEKRYSFDQSLFGSYATYVPDHYEFGYQLTAYTRTKYEENVWSNVENYVARNSYTLLPTPFAFYKGLKKQTGLSQKGLYNETLNYLDSLWTNQVKTKDIVNPDFIQEYEINEYEDYLNPVYVDNDNIVALKKGVSHIPQFVLVNNKSEKILYEPGYVIANDFSYSKNLLVWAEYQPDLRWANREYTAIKLFNIKTKRDYYLVTKSRFFSPDLSSKSDKIVVVKVDKTNENSLVILDIFDGHILKEITPNRGSFLQRPQWSEDGKFIYAIELTEDGKQVSRYNLEDDKWEFLFSLKDTDIQRILPAENKVFFHSTLNGTDNIYVFEEKSGNIFQLSNAKFGISGFDLSANNNKLIVDEYTSQGFRLADLPTERALWKKITKEDKFNYQFAEQLKEQESSTETQNVKSENEYRVTSYRKPLNLFNFHSWIPFYVDYDNMDLNNAFSDPSEIYNNIYPGITFLSQNKLSTVDAILAYAYKNGNHFLSSSLVFRGQYPVLKLTANYGSEQLIRTTSYATWYPETNLGYSYDVDVSVPLNLTRGKNIRGFIPSVSVEYFDHYYYNYLNDYYINGLEIVESDLLFYAYQMKSTRDIIPRVGAVFNAKLVNTPFEQELYGHLYNFNTIFYIPGWKNSGFQINFGYQYQNPELYLFSSNFSFPKGIEQRRTEKMTKLYGDYVFPIAYPDWSLGSAFYLKRIRGDIFADYAFNTYRTVNANQTAYIWPKENFFSFGFELTADYHLLRTIFPLNTGVRLGYSPTESKLFYEVLFGIDLYNF